MEGGVTGGCLRWTDISSVSSVVLLLLSFRTPHRWCWYRHTDNQPFRAVGISVVREFYLLKGGGLQDAIHAWQADEMTGNR